MENKKTKKDEFDVELIDKFSDEELFDDCPICQAMKAAKNEGRELTLTELQELFKKANEEQNRKMGI